MVLKNADGYDWSGDTVSSITGNEVRIDMLRGPAAGVVPTLNYAGTDWFSTTGKQLDVFTGFPVQDV